MDTQLATHLRRTQAFGGNPPSHRGTQGPKDQEQGHRDWTYSTRLGWAPTRDHLSPSLNTTLTMNYDEYPDDGPDDKYDDDDRLFEHDEDPHEDYDDDQDEDYYDDRDEDYDDGEEFLFRCAALYKGAQACKAIFETEIEIYEHLNNEHHTSKWLVQEFVSLSVWPPPPTNLHCKHH